MLEAKNPDQKSDGGLGVPLTPPKRSFWIVLWIVPLLQGEQGNVRLRQDSGVEGSGQGIPSGETGEEARERDARQGVREGGRKGFRRRHREVAGAETDACFAALWLVGSRGT